MSIAFSGTRNQEVEALRGIAILFVLFAHMGGHLYEAAHIDRYLGLRQWLETGTGVDLFFCVSGYVITRGFAQHAPDRLSWAGFYGFAVPFWIRRFWRLAPSAWLWALFSVWYAAFWTSDPASFLATTRDAVAALLHVANLHVYECANQINATQCGSLGIYWSLSLEEQFYLLFPFILMILPRRLRIPFFVMVFAAQAFLPGRTYANLSWLVRTDAIALGVTIALMQQTSAYRLIEPIFLRFRLARGLWLAVWLVLLAGVSSPKGHMVEFSTGLVAICSAALVWTASFGVGYSMPSVILRRILAFVGQRSYAIYLIHYPAVSITALGFTYLMPRSTWGMVDLMAFPVLLALADLNYWLIEQPLRAYGSRVAARIRDKAAALDARPAALTRIPLAAE